MEPIATATTIATGVFGTVFGGWVTKLVFEQWLKGLDERHAGLTKRLDSMESKLDRQMAEDSQAHSEARSMLARIDERLKEGDRRFSELQDHQETDHVRLGRLEDDVGAMKALDSARRRAR